MQINKALVMQKNKKEKKGDASVFVLCTLARNIFFMEQ
jgi:hypothetical protein